MPGAGFSRMVYDKLNRVVLENDDKDLVDNFYKFTRYDVFNRPIQTGLINDIGATSRTTLQTAFDGHPVNLISEERGTTLLGYTNRSFPFDYKPEDGNMKTVSYFDDLLWNSDTTYNFKATNAYHLQYANVKGMMTGGLVRNLETGDWYKAVNYYDYKGRGVQTFAQNHLGGIDRMEYNYRFNGEVLKMRTTHRKTGATDIVEISEFDYDHFGRKTKFRHSLNGSQKTIAKYVYDNVGRLKQKAFSPTDAIGSSQTGLWTNNTTWQGGSLPTLADKVTINTGHTVTIPNGQTMQAGTLFNQGILQNFGVLQMGTLAANSSTGALQTVDFKYHIRGALRGINLDANNNPSIANGKLFSMKLGYEESGNYYDGNIQSQTWVSSIDNLTRSYTYSYDKSNRILGASYTGGKPNENYGLNSVTYDVNGNIKTLSRNGLKANNTFGLIDNLAYTYQTNSNKIQKVDDNSAETASFTDATGITDYTYSADGSLISDANKGISVIEYNYLKLPRRIVKGGVNILYQYDASGKKLKETIGTQMTDYVGNLIYKNNSLYQLSHDEGRVVDNIYEYNIKDHLGSLRVSFKDSLGIAKVTQANSYGVWGEDLTTLSYRNTPKLDNFKFTDKENLPETGYTDFGARLYDNLVPRFISVDPLSEISRRFSPYTYANNNPQIFIDPDGMASRYNWESKRYEDEKGNEVSWESVRDEYYFNEKGEIVDHVENNLPDKFFIRNTLSVFNSTAFLTNSSYESKLNIDTEIPLNSDLGVLARIGYAEFREGNYTELEAGLDVTNNRLLQNYRGASTMEDVVTSPRQYSSLNKGEEEKSNGLFYRNTLKTMGESVINKISFLRSMSAAIKVYNGYSGITQGALNYYSPRSMSTENPLPLWDFTKLQKVNIIGARSSFISVYKDK